MSHLHLMQQRGVIKLASLPFWFLEGIAAYVSDGGGAGSVSTEEAADAIKEGMNFIPHEDGGILFRKTPSHWGLKPHMFYRQSMMFISFLAEYDSTKFRTMIIRIQDGKAFEGLVDSVYGKGLSELWDDFKMALSDEY